MVIGLFVDANMMFNINGISAIEPMPFNIPSTLVSTVMLIKNPSISPLEPQLVKKIKLYREEHNEQIVDAFCNSSKRALMYKNLFQALGESEGFDSHLAIAFLLNWQLKSQENPVPALELLRKCREGFIDAYLGLAENAGFNDSISKCVNVLSQAGVHVSEDWVLQMFFKPDFEDANSANAANILAIKLQQDLTVLFNDWLDEANATQDLEQTKSYLKLTQEHLSIFLNQEKYIDKTTTGADITSSFVYLVGVPKFMELFNNAVPFENAGIIDINIKPIMSLQLNDAAHPYNLSTVYANTEGFQFLASACQFYHSASLNAIHRIFKGCLVDAYLIANKEITGAKVGAIFWGEEDAESLDFWRATALLVGSGMIADLRKSENNQAKKAA